MCGSMQGWKPIKDEDSEPAAWDQTLRELEQLGRVSLWLGEHHPELKGQEIDTAIIGLISELEAAAKRKVATEAKLTVVGTNEATEELVEIRRALKLEQEKAERLERHIVKITGHPDGPMSAHRPEEPNGTKPLGKSWIEPSKRLDPKPVDGLTSRRAALGVHMQALQDGKPTQTELRPMLILMAQMLLDEAPTANVQRGNGELDVKRLTEVERQTVDGVRNLLGKLKGDGTMSLAEVGERLKGLSPKE